MFLGEQQRTLLKSVTVTGAALASHQCHPLGSCWLFMTLPYVRWRVHVFHRQLAPGKTEGEESVDVRGEVWGGTCQGLSGDSGTTCSLGDFCVISNIITLANNLFCRYGGQICLCSAIQNEAIS